MRVTAYCYPWDLARLGVERVLDEMADHGIAAIDLAATYHPIDALSPRGGARLFTSARGAVHFPARADRYGRIRPSFSPDAEIRAAWPAVASAAPTRGVALNAWTVVLYQPWICDAHPDCARVLPSGDPMRALVCPSSDDFREYLAALCTDLVEQFDLDVLRFENVMPMSYDYGWLRPRVLVDVAPLARQLLTLCFCASCVRRASDEAIDVERVRRVVNETIDAEIDEPAASGTADRAARLAADPELHRFVVQHERASIELVDVAVSRLDAARRPRVSTNVQTPFSMLLGESQRSLVAELLARLDQASVSPTRAAPLARLVADLAAASPRAVTLSALVTPVPVGLPGASASAAEDDGARIRRELEAAAALGVEEVSIYNYGLLRDRDVRALMAAIAAAPE